MDRQTFDRMLLGSLDEAMRFAIKLTGDPSVAEDLVHDALTRASASWRSFRAESSFRTWLFQIIVNSFRDRLRRRAVPEELPDWPADPRGTDPAAGLVGEELATLVARHVSGLPPRQREVLVLVAYEGMTAAQTAELLRISEQNVRVNLHLARQRLKQLLAPYLSENQRETGTASIPRE